MPPTYDAAVYETAWREAAHNAAAQQEARSLVEGQNVKLRSQLRESERLRSIEVQKLTVQIERMKSDIMTERDRVATLEREFSLAFETELQKIRRKSDEPTEARIALERMKKNLVTVEKEKSLLMSRLSKAEKEAQAKARKRSLVETVYSSEMVTSNGTTIAYNILVWDVIAVIMVLVILYCLLWFGFPELQTADKYEDYRQYFPAYDYIKNSS